MTTEDLINTLSILVLVGFLVVLCYLIVFLHRANHIIGKIDNLSETFKGFVKDIVPAIVNMGTIVAAVQTILRQLAAHHAKEKRTSKE